MTDKQQAALALTISQAERIVPVSRATMYRAIKTGQLKSVRLGGRRLITEQQPRDWIANNTDQGSK